MELLRTTSLVCMALILLASIAAAFPNDQAQDNDALGLRERRDWIFGDVFAPDEDADSLPLERVRRQAMYSQGSLHWNPHHRRGRNRGRSSSRRYRPRPYEPTVVDA